MKIAVLHRVPFHKVRYDEVLDHQALEITYVGKAQDLDGIPAGIPHERMQTDSSLPIDLVGQLKNARIDYIIALSEYDLLAAAELREHLKLPGPGVQQALKVRDKIIMKKSISSAGIACPRHAPAVEINSALNWTAPFVLKPARAASSEGVVICDTFEALCKRVSELGPDKLPNYEIEEFIDGLVFHFDGWIKDAVIQDFVASRYVGTCYRYLLGEPLGSLQLSDLSEEMKAWSSNVITALEMKSGAFHLEAIFSRGKFHFLEIAHRVGGAGVAQTFEMKTGINLYHAHIASELGLSCNSRRVESGLSFGWFVYPGHVLRTPYCTVNGSEGIMKNPEIFDLRVQKPWEKLKNHPKLTYLATESPFSGLLRCVTSDHAERTITEIFKTVKIEEYTRFKSESRAVFTTIVE